MAASSVLEQDFFAAVLDQPIQFPSDSEVDDILNSLVVHAGEEGVEHQQSQQQQAWVPFAPTVGISPFATVVPTSPEHSSISGSPAMSPSNTSGTHNDNDDEDDEDDEGGDGKKKRKREAKKVELEFIGLTADQVGIMSSKDFEDYVKLKQASLTLTKEQQKHIKWVRRKIMNREYAVLCRKKKADKWQELEVRVHELENENSLLKHQVAQLASENHELRKRTSTKSLSSSSSSFSNPTAAGAVCLFVLLFSFGLWFTIPGLGGHPSAFPGNSGSAGTGRVILDTETASNSMYSWWLRLVYGSRVIDQKRIEQEEKARLEKERSELLKKNLHNGGAAAGSGEEISHEDELQCFTRAELDRLVSNAKATMKTADDHTATRHSSATKQREL